LGNLNGWNIGENLYKWIIDNIEPNRTILELGSGTGTIELVKHYNVFSVEQNKEYVGLEPKSNYIYAPLVNYEGRKKWYDVDKLQDLPSDYDLLLIDGPIGSNRRNFIDHIHLFKHLNHIKIIIDDTNRKWDRWLVDEILKIWTNKKIITEVKDGKKIATILG
tara:strand:+ start:354 stop:842 length:489 start_codon:yes stop_codon:yes gene_type:complete